MGLLYCIPARVSSGPAVPPCRQDTGADALTRVRARRLLAGGTLWDRLELRTRLPECDVRVIARRLLETLAAMAELGVSHMDVKPANIGLAEPRNLESCTLFDMGSWRHTGEALPLQCSGLQRPFAMSEGTQGGRKGQQHMHRGCCPNPGRGALLPASVPAPHRCSDGLTVRRRMAGTVLKPGEFLGTAVYSSLEAVQNFSDEEGGGGGGGFDLQRDDSYAAGATLFELLTGELPVVVAEEDEFLLPAYEAAILQLVLARRIRLSVAARGACRCRPLAGDRAIAV